MARRRERPEDRLSLEVYDRMSRLSRDLLDLQVARGASPPVAVAARIAGLYTCLMEAMSHSRRIRNELPAGRECAEKLLADDLADLMTAALDRTVPRRKHTVVIVSRKK